MEAATPSHRGAEPGRTKSAPPAPSGSMAPDSLFAFNTQHYSRMFARLDAEDSEEKANTLSKLQQGVLDRRRQQADAIPFSNSYSHMPTLSDLGGSISGSHTLGHLPTLMSMDSPEPSPEGGSPRVQHFSKLGSSSPDVDFGRAPRESGLDEAKAASARPSLGAIGGSGGARRGGNVPASLSLNYLLQRSDEPLGLGDALRQSRTGSAAEREGGGVRASASGDFSGLPSWGEQRPRRHSTSAHRVDEDSLDTASGSSGIATVPSSGSLQRLVQAKGLNSAAGQQAGQQQQQAPPQVGHPQLATGAGGVLGVQQVLVPSASSGMSYGTAGHPHTLQQGAPTGGMHWDPQQGMVPVMGGMAPYMGAPPGMAPPHMHFGPGAMQGVSTGVQAPANPHMIPAHGAYAAPGAGGYGGYAPPGYGPAGYAPPPGYGSPGYGSVGYGAPPGYGPGAYGQPAHLMMQPPQGMMQDSTSPPLMPAGQPVMMTPYMLPNGVVTMGLPPGASMQHMAATPMVFYPQQPGAMPHQWNPAGAVTSGMDDSQQSKGGADGAATGARSAEGGRAAAPKGGGRVAGRSSTERVRQGDQARGESSRGERVDVREARERAPKRITFQGQEICTVEEVAAMGAVVELALDQHGCRFLQEQVEHAPNKTISLVLEPLLAQLPELMTDAYGNYLIQKVVQYASHDQQLELIKCLAPSLADVSLNVHGTRAVQRILECVRGEEVETLVADALAPRLEELMEDLHANHVVQRCVATLTGRRSDFIFEAVQRNFVAVGTHRHGCCVLQRCLDNALGSVKQALVQRVIDHTPEMIADQYGNYVVQYILQLRDADLTRKVVQAVKGSIADLACQKFSSNVIEKCLTSGDEWCMNTLVEEVTTEACLGRLLHDPYGNYVIQRLLQVAGPDSLTLIGARLEPHMGSLRNTLYGKRIHAKIVKALPDLAAGGGGGDGGRR